MSRSKPKLTVIMYSPENESPGFLGVSYSFYHTDAAADKFIYAMKVLGWSLMVRRPFHQSDIPRMHVLDQQEFKPKCIGEFRQEFYNKDGTHDGGETTFVYDNMKSAPEFLQLKTLAEAQAKIIGDSSPEPYGKIIITKVTINGVDLC